MASLTLELILPTWKKKKWQKGLRMPELTLPVLAALTPPDVDLIVTEEENEEVVYKSHVGLVGISYMTPLAARAYEIADEYRRHGPRWSWEASTPRPCPKRPSNTRTPSSSARRKTCGRP